MNVETKNGKTVEKDVSTWIPTEKLVSKMEKFNLFKCNEQKFKLKSVQSNFKFKEQKLKI